MGWVVLVLWRQGWRVAELITTSQLVIDWVWSFTGFMSFIGTRDWG